MDCVGWALAHPRAACAGRTSPTWRGDLRRRYRVMPPAPCRHVELPPRLGARWHLLLHREPAGAPLRLARRTHRPAARRIPGGEGASTVPSAGHRGVTRPHLHGVWQLPDGDADNANRWAQIKSGFQPGVAHPRTPIIAAYRSPGGRRVGPGPPSSHTNILATAKRASHDPPGVFLLTLTVSLLSLRLSRDRKRSNVPPKSVFLLSLRSNVPPQRVVLLSLTVSRHRKTSNVSPKRCMRQRKRVVLLTHRLAHRPKGPGMAPGGACASVLPRSAGFATQPTGPRRSDRRHVPPAS